ncbi:hypothetical protein OKA05_27830 [Luteolibacter arcticus]|uniref:HEAT repeat domain-containing protein n=1 Tax=Luteolibacter arcticus TaxID=1581411 RepID=A0ABT3GSC0_9BACT|nr:hypothetical protein [Luteolibacter arcticus]MCW1926393.1 hypothetical protein [Luteolibacter arcticus]
MSKVFKLSAVALLLSALVAILLVPSKEEVLDDFYHGVRSEEQLMDPLIVHSRRVADSIAAKVADPEMPRRLYAITFLGVDKTTSALDVLQSIADDDHEPPIIRSAALKSAFQISGETGFQLAEKYKNREDVLGDVSKSIVEGTLVTKERSFWDACLGRAGDH